MRALPLAAVLGLLLAALILIGRSFAPRATESAAAAVELPRYSVSNARWLRLNGQGQPEFRAEAGSIEYFRDDTARMTALAVDALGGWSSPWQVRAPRGVAHPGERRMLLDGGVDAQGASAEGRPLAFRTERLWVDLLRREMHTDAGVTMESAAQRGTARGLRADFQGERVQLLDDVRMEYEPS